MKMVEKTSAFERVNHFVLLATFFILLITGTGFAFHSLNWMNTLFGGNAYADIFHRWFGVVFGISLIFSITSYIGEALSFGPEDSEWLSKFGGYFDKNVKITSDQGKMNMGQKIFYLVVVLICGGLVSLTGFMLWFGSAMGLSHILHYIAYMVMAIAVPLHIYLATAANPGTFRIMTRGTVPLSFAKKKFAKWVKEEGLE